MSQCKFVKSVSAPNVDLLVDGEFDPFTNFYIEVLKKVHPNIFDIYNKEEILKKIDISKFWITKCYANILEEKIKYWIKKELKKKKYRYNKNIVNKEYMMYNFNVGPAGLLSEDNNYDYTVYLEEKYLRINNE